MKKSLKFPLLLLMAVLAVLLLTACAKPRLDYDAKPEEPAVVLTKVTVGDIVYQDMTEYLLVYDYIGSSEELTLPQTVEITRDGKTAVLPVKGIAGYAFADCSTLVTITLHDGITAVGSDAFSGCTSLRTVNGLSHVTSLGDRAFAGCTALESITVPASIGALPRSLFYHCTSLQTVVIEDGITAIGRDAFENCTALANIRIPNSVTSISKFAFHNCTSLSTVTLPSGLTVLDSSLFEGCSALTSLQMPAAVVELRDKTFAGCHALADITFADSIEEIDGTALEETLWYYMQPEGAVYAGKVLYRYKGTPQEMTDIVVQEGTISISDSAFYSLSNIRTVTLPDGLRMIGKDVSPD